MFNSTVLLVAAAPHHRRAVLAEQLRADAAEVYTGSDYAQTRAGAAVHRPDALLLGDLRPDAPSVELLRAVRASTGLPTEPSADLPVIAFVDTADQLAVLRAFHAGADEVSDHRGDYAFLPARLLVLLGLAGSRTRVPTVKVGALQISHAQGCVWLHGEAVDLLATLAADLTRVFDRMELLRDDLRRPRSEAPASASSRGCRTTGLALRTVSARGRGSRRASGSGRGRWLPEGLAGSELVAVELGEVVGGHQQPPFGPDS